MKSKKQQGTIITVYLSLAIGFLARGQDSTVAAPKTSTEDSTSNHVYRPPRYAARTSSLFHRTSELPSATNRPGFGLYADAMMELDWEVGAILKKDRLASAASSTPSNQDPRALANNGMFPNLPYRLAGYRIRPAQDPGAVPP